MTHVGFGGFVLYVLSIIIAFVAGFFVGKKNGKKVAGDFLVEKQYLLSEIGMLRQEIKDIRNKIANKV